MSIRESAILDHDGSTRETRSPEEIATDWRDVLNEQGEDRLVHRRTFRSSDDVTKISYSDAAGDISAVLVFRRGPVGWQLSTIVTCGQDK
jgi:hypothetical protein